MCVMLFIAYEEYGEKVNYISIDTEGLEWEILKEFNFEKYDVEIFNIEKSGDNVKNLLIEKNYKLVMQTISNWIFVKNGLVDEERVLNRVISKNERKYGLQEEGS